MKHPKSSDVLKIVKNFESILHLATREGHLNMSCGAVNIDYECGTTHCHAGWYAIASGLHLENRVNYIHGRNKMAKDLGFNNYNELQIWAKENPTIWGNKFGKWMFCDKRAFYHPTKRPNGAETLQHIIYHWVEVADKLAIMEISVALMCNSMNQYKKIYYKSTKNKQINYEDITALIAKLPLDETSDSPSSIKEIRELVHE